MALFSKFSLVTDLSRPVFLFLSLVFILSSCSENKDEVALEKELLGVTLAPITQGSVSSYEFAEGTTYAIKREFLVFESSGRVAMIKTNPNGHTLREGDFIKGPSKEGGDGELLAQLDVRGENASIAAAKADLENARARLMTAKNDFERATRLKNAGAIEARRFDSIETEYKQAQGGVKGSQARLQETIAGSRSSEIRAPFDGVVAFININEGQYFSPSQYDPTSPERAVTTAPIVIIDPSAFEITVDLPVYQGSQVKEGQTAYLLDGEDLARFQAQGIDEDTKQISNLSELFVPATVTSVSPSVNPGDRSVRARLITTDSKNRLIDGAYITAWIKTHEKNNVVLAPSRGIIHRGSEAYAFVYSSATQQVTKRFVKEGIFGIEGIEIIEGLIAGEQVVIDGRYRLTDGMKVKILSATE